MRAEPSRGMNGLQVDCYEMGLNGVWEATLTPQGYACEQMRRQGMMPFRTYSVAFAFMGFSTAI